MSSLFDLFFLSIYQHASTVSLSAIFFGSCCWYCCCSLPFSMLLLARLQNLRGRAPGVEQLLFFFFFYFSCAL